MTLPIVSQDAIFVGVNRYSDVCDESNGLVAFGAGRSVSLWRPDPTGPGISATLNRHPKDVTAVKFVLGSQFIVSGSEDGLLCLWSKSPSSISNHVKYTLSSFEQQDEGSVTAIAVSDDGTIVSGSSLGSINIWKVVHSQLSKLSLFTVQRNFLPTCLAIQKIEQSHILAVGGTSTNIFVYSFTLEQLASESPALCASLPGHEDWIKCFAFVCERPGLDYILASGSQDRYIRLWRLRLKEAIDSSDDDDSKLQLLSNKQYKFSISEGDASFSFEALIMGHDDWVSGLKWHPSTSAASPEARKLQLLSLSADTALMIWEMDSDSGVWVSISRLGELSIKGASTATGSSGGFWSCLWFVDGHQQCILATGKTGAIRVYRSSDPDNRIWDASLGLTGPIRDVTDIVWARDGAYFYATSLDQTTRLFAPWSKNKANLGAKRTWHEFARPQIHGYDMVCLDNLSGTKFVSAGEEKILRVFEMTQSIHTLLSTFCDVSTESETIRTLPEAASLPVLGLSNKAANDQLQAGEAQQREEDFENKAASEELERSDPLSELAGPPLEDHLQRFTLFPELDKLYGHGYEITCCACLPDGALIATACRSNSAKHAVIRIFNANKNYLLVDDVLSGHNLTVTSMEFSPDGQYLLAVSRDRQFSLWRVRDESEGTFDLVELNEKAHTRIIWDASWLPGSSTYFVTCSRDKSIKLWEICGGSVVLQGVVKTESPVTSISAYPRLLETGSSIIAIGNEEGKISIYTVDLSTEEPFNKVLSVGDADLPAARVSKLSFSRKAVDGKLQLAVGSADSSIRVYSVAI